MGVGIALLVILGLAVVVLLWAVGIYNSLVRLKNEVDNGWAQIDVQLKRRYDLIPNLVETVKGYASHERETLEKVIQARNMAMSAAGPAEQAAAENMLTNTLKSLFALSEAYPDLKANTNFLALQEELVATENKISFSRQFYNDRVMMFNTAIEVFPANMVANFFPGKFTKREFFETTEAAEREAVQVKF